jgi:hypothetical protein
LGDYLYAWRIPDDEDTATTTMRNHSVIADIGGKLPSYHTCQMRKDFLEHAGRICEVQPAIIWWMYLTLAGDSSAAASAKQADVDHCDLVATDSEDDVISFGIFKS